MGNCIETFVRSRVEENGDPQQEGRGGGGSAKENGCVRIKVVLTKEELGWMILQLKDKSRGKRLEDVLEEIGRGRGKLAEAWKPSLDSIMESPEVPDQMHR